MNAEFTWRSGSTHTVRRRGFTVTYANYLTSTACHGNTLRAGVTVDCARLEPQGMQGMKDDIWWFHIYVMLSRATQMEDLLLLRPPPREFFERGPPPSIVAALRQFEAKTLATEAAAEELARTLGIQIPA